MSSPNEFQLHIMFLTLDHTTSNTEDCTTDQEITHPRQHKKLLISVR